MNLSVLPLDSVVSTIRSVFITRDDDYLEGLPDRYLEWNGFEKPSLEVLVDKFNLVLDITEKTLRDDSLYFKINGVELRLQVIDEPVDRAIRISPV